MCTGKIEKKAVVINDEIVIRPILNAVCTFDHRYGDASISVKFLKIIRAYVTDPEGFNIDNYPDSKPWYEIEAEKKGK
jgi:2-oxoglutarate dehydrogenase E2 component (dihydrolipoamide succinyltransferase)